MTRTLQRFELLSQAGAGAIGTVYRARDPQLDRDVAIKLLDRSHAPPPGSTIDLRAPGANDHLDEARIMARLSHPNVLAIYEVGVDDDTPFLVMEFVDGATLREWARDHSQPEIVAAFAQAVRGLAAAHEVGIVHRDFKPDNVMIGRDGRVRVCDFGLGLVRQERVSMERVSDTRGTPKYMAPELSRGAVATPASDVFAVCTSLAELVPRPTKALAEVIARGTSDDPAARPSLPQILAALEPKRSRRWLVGIAAGAALAGGAVWAATRHGHVTCTLPPTADRASLATFLAPKHTPAIDATASRILARYDAATNAIANAMVGACDARDDPHFTTRRACIERRAIELSGDVSWLLARPWDLARAEEVIGGTTSPAGCATIGAPAMTLDRAAVVALWSRLPRGIDYDSDRDRIADLQTLATDAERGGELELAVRAKILLARRLAVADRLPDANTVLRDASRIATAINSDELSALVLAHRGRLAGQTGDRKAMATYEKQAIDKAPGMRARIIDVLTRGELERNEYRVALATLRRGLDGLLHSDGTQPLIEASLRFGTVTAMANLDDERAAAVATAKASSDWAKTAFGDTGITYAMSLDSIASAYAANGDAKTGLPYREQALQLLQAELPANHRRVISERHAIADDHMRLGDRDSAVTELKSIIAATETDPALRSMRPDLLCDLGDAIGGTESALYEQALAETSGSEANTVRLRLIDRLLDAGRLDDAATHITALETAYTSKPKLAALHGARTARLALLRGDAKQAEATARQALDDITAPIERERTLVVLGSALKAQQHDGAAAFEQALAIARARHATAERIATLTALLH
ncbi:MAG: serine/threonine-protein kinase [Kofleriaceae bacterium]